MSLSTKPVDFIEELRLRRWARENYVAAHERSADWHAVVHSEMNRRDSELAEVEMFRLAPSIVPLAPSRFDEPHTMTSHITFGTRAAVRS